MTSARDSVLGSIRRGLRRGPLTGAAAEALRARLANPPPGPLPERAKGVGEDRLVRFIDMAERVSASVARIRSLDQLAPALAEYLKAHNLPTTVVASDDPVLDGLADHPMLTVRRGLPTPGDTVAVVPAFGAIAETGTLALRSGSERASTLNFLPDTHVVVLRAADLVGGLEEIWARLRAEGQGGLPRTINFITGPSRTGDIEQTIQLGAHGPLRLHILIVDESA
ncbi:lactate utilization protein [Rhodospirillum rubrum]|uniref:LutC/YkgG family protein n=1 Tax=Rhodospirillum rubrum TaxID=1085 RepID=UPI001908B8B8|nr:lactate utilization protein [Rhodospirillum rubrum]MBK1663209.1 lactate utilization protein [Rhodospirillum rubrum]MBK1676962.1 lactate utilization protein [Rhodospirillum rubrum]